MIDIETEYNLSCLGKVDRWRNGNAGNLGSDVKSNLLEEVAEKGVKNCKKHQAKRE